MELAGITLMSNGEVVRSYERSVLDLGFLQKMLESCSKSSGAYAHYFQQVQREQETLDLLTAEMEKRKLFA